MSALTLTPPGTFTNPAVKPLLDMYRQVVAQRYTPCPPSDLARLLAAPPYHVSRKIDGELWFLLTTDDGPLLVAANGRTAHGTAPVLATTLPQGTILAGELHVAKDGTRERVGDVAAALVNAADALLFAAFDVIAHADTTWRDTTYVDRLTILQDLLPTSGPVHAIPVTTVEAEADVAGLYTDIVDTTGAEGIIVRCSDGRALKVKPEITIDTAVLGYTTRTGPNGPEVRSLLLGISTGTGSWIPVGTAGNISESVDRTQLLALLEPLNVDSSYRRAASTGQLYRMTRPDILIECRVLDVQVEDSRGKAVRQPELTLTDTWTVTGQIPAATLINPIVTRVRDDKPDPQRGAGWTQLAPYIPEPGTHTGALPASDVIRRQVWTKTGKDKTDVRKLVVWRTNKEHIDPAYPAYVVHWTDYSAGRKTPLTREVRPVPTEDAAMAVADAMIADNIKKGWDEQA